MIKFSSIHTCIYIYIYNFEDCLTKNDCQVHTALRQARTIHVFYIESRLRILWNLLFIAKGSTDANKRYTYDFEHFTIVTYFCQKYFEIKINNKEWLKLKRNK